MHIERIQIDEGFLDGLDLRLVPGLNVVIGPRGSGKSSLIELIRFCLGGAAFTEAAGRRGQQHAEAVLAGGQVTLTLTNGADRVTVVRSTADNSPRSTGEIPDITVLGQGEIEAVGAQARGRLHLIDRLRPERRDLERATGRTKAELRSVTTEIRDVLLEVDEMQAALEQSKAAPGELKDALAQEAGVLSSAKATEKDRTQLAALQGLSAQLSVRRDVFDRALTDLETLATELKRLEGRSVLAEEWPESAGEHDLLRELRDSLARDLMRIGEVRTRVDSAVSRVNELKQADVATRVKIDDEARQLRLRLEVVEQGVGAVTRRVEQLKEVVGQRTALQKRVRQRVARVADSITLRDESYRELDTIRQGRFLDRQRVASAISQHLRPSVRVDVVRSQNIEAYLNAIVSALRGSGLHYNTLGPTLASRMSPLELIKAVEARDPGPIAQAAEISDQRAGAVVEHLRTADLAKVISATIQDGVTLQLLDGSDYKTSEEVSIGQRCTTVLPVLLSREGGILVVDQPEDQLDNAYVANTVVHALRLRGTGDQLLFASHNANIPVLGEADLVVALGSNGKRGYPTHIGPLSDPETVTTIIDVMEGGAEAFRRRKQFYEASGPAG